MKKLLLIPLCLFLLFGTSLALAAEEPNCSVPNAVGPIVHGTTEYQSDASHHWLACTLCGARTGGWGEHTVSCDQPTVCLVCAANDLSVPYYHSVGNTYVTTETQHALLCLRCNQPCYWSNHAAYCHSENLCVSCGETVTSAELIHNDECMGLVCFEKVNGLFCRLLCQPGTPIVPHKFQSHRCVNCGSWDGPGDVNGDGSLNHRDLHILARYLSGHRVFLYARDFADVNQDGMLDMLDYKMLYEFFAMEGAGY